MISGIRIIWRIIPGTAFVKAPAIKAHGSSDSKAIKNAVKQATDFSNTGVIDQIEKALKGEKENG